MYIPVHVKVYPLSKLGTESQMYDNFQTSISSVLYAVYLWWGDRSLWLRVMMLVVHVFVIMMAMLTNLEGDGSNTFLCCF